MMQGAAITGARSGMAPSDNDRMENPSEEDPGAISFLVGLVVIATVLAFSGI